MGAKPRHAGEGPSTMQPPVQQSFSRSVECQTDPDMDGWSVDEERMLPVGDRKNPGAILPQTATVHPSTPEAPGIEKEPTAPVIETEPTAMHPRHSHPAVIEPRVHSRE